MELPELWQQQDLQGSLADTEGDRAAREAFGIGQLGFGGAELMMGSCDAGLQLLTFRCQGHTAV